MSSTQYTRGRAFEYRVRDRLKYDGYVTFRSAGSRSPVDVIALKLGHTVFVQAKRDGHISPAERRALLDAATAVGAVPVIAFHLANKPIQFRTLTGPGAKEHIPWTPDEVTGPPADR